MIMKYKLDLRQVYLEMVKKVKIIKMHHHYAVLFLHGSFTS